jgi:hypothetical protein
MSKLLTATPLKSDHFLCMTNEYNSEFTQRTIADKRTDINNDLSNEKVEQLLIEFVNDNEFVENDFFIITSDFLKNFDLFEEEYLSQILRVKQLY